MTREVQRSVLIACSGNGDYSSVLHKNPTSGNFLKVSCSEVSETMSMNVLYLITLKPIDLLSLWPFLPERNFVTYMGYLKILVHQIMLIIQMLMYFIQYLKITVISITSHFIRKVYKDFLGGPVVENLPVSTGDMGLIPGPGRFHIPQSN